jgi:exopolysaccharide production protein ExoY
MHQTYARKQQQNRVDYPFVVVADAGAGQPCGGALKRAFDFTVALIAIIILSPLLICVALAVKLSDGGPAFFGHKRVGFSGKTFKCWKFRSMVPNSEAIFQKYLAENPHAALEWKQNQKIKNDPRITPLGHVLRKYSIDELPQLFNILMGDMSFVGPRPIQKTEYDKYGYSLRHYLSTRPGLTGLWQVSGRSNSTYQKRVAFDRYYVTHWGMLTDIGLIIKTVPVAVTGSGSY